MAHDYSRGKLYDPDTNTTFDMGKVTSEDVSLSGGVVSFAIPGFGTAGNIGSAPMGKVRIITAEGVKYGTQAQIEAFVKQFTDRVDVTGFGEELYYYPLFHHSNATADANNGLQKKYFPTLIINFSYRTSEKDGGFLCIYDLEMKDLGLVLE